MQDCKLGIKSSRIPVFHPTQRSNDENFGSIYLCIQFATEENKTHPWLYCKQHTQKKFGCFQDRNEENNNNAILKIMNERRIFFGELSIRSTLSKRKRATGLGLSVEVQETQI